MSHRVGGGLGAAPRHWDPTGDPWPCHGRHAENLGEPQDRGSVGTHPACALLTHQLPNNLGLSPGSSHGRWGRAAPQNHRENTGGTRRGCLTCSPHPGCIPYGAGRHSLGRSRGWVRKICLCSPGSLSGLSCSGGGRNEPPRGFPPASGVGRARSCGEGPRVPAGHPEHGPACSVVAAR